MGYPSNMIKNSGIPIDLVKKITTAFNVPYFVETGTAGGESVRLAAELFKDCHTIEVVKERAIINKKLDWPDNIYFYNADSIEVLPNILEGFKDEYALYWLDAHYSDNVPAAEGVVECPLLQELDIISKHQQAIILIDDARLFLGPPPWPNDPRQWPRIDEIFAAIKAKYPWHYTTIVDDYIVSLPDTLKDVLDKEWLENFDKRYPSEKERLRTESKHVVEWFFKFIER
jgi:hypothetical protein